MFEKEVEAIKDKIRKGGSTCCESPEGILQLTQSIVNLSQAELNFEAIRNPQPDSARIKMADDDD